MHELKVVINGIETLQYIFPDGKSAILFARGNGWGYGDYALMRRGEDFEDFEDLEDFQPEIASAVKEAGLEAEANVILERVSDGFHSQR